MDNERLPAPSTEQKTADVRKPVEQWAAEKGHLPQPFDAARVGKRWVVGKEITEAEYDQAIAWLSSQDCVCR